MGKIQKPDASRKLLIVMLGCIISIQSAIAPKLLTPQTMDTLLTAIDNIIFSPNAPGSLRIAKLLRAPFHDCMGGCDARINLEKTHNRGLERLVRQLVKTYYDDNNPFKTTLSRADFWVLCYLRALGWGIKNGSTSEEFPVLGPNFVVYKYGRTNTTFHADYDDIEGPFPDGMGNWTGTRGGTSVLGGLTAGFKGLVSEYDIVALLGLHYAGVAAPENSGFAGPWGDDDDIDIVSNGLYPFIMGYGEPNDFELVQTNSALQTQRVIPLEKEYFSDPPPKNKLQWTRSTNNGTGRIMMNVDMGIYHTFTAAPDGTAPGKACPQLGNLTLFDCSAVDPSYMPLSPNAQQAHSYVHNSTLFYVDVINAMLKVTSVPSEYDDADRFLSFRPEYVCVDSVAVCRGDVLKQGCAGFPYPC